MANTEKLQQLNLLVEEITNKQNAVPLGKQIATSLDIVQEVLEGNVADLEGLEDGVENARATAAEAKEIAQRAEGTANTAKETAEQAEAAANEVKGTAERAEGTANTAKTIAEGATATADAAKASAETAKGVAESAKHTATAAQEAAERAEGTANTAKTTAERAEDTASDAKTTADGVKVIAERAEGTANTAKTIAERADGTANTAKTTADSVKGIAERAEGTANTAKTIAERADGTANTAKTTADSVKGIAERAEGTANTAKTIAERADGTAKDAKTTADSVKGIAERAESTANTAKTTADSVKGIAERAEGTANTAKTIAERAEDTAKDAKTTADSVKGIAERAESTANNAKTTADSVKGIADRAESTANTAVETADRAEGTANTALETANRAEGAANTAQETADRAEGTANTALETAERAEDTANTANDTANEAHEIATAAQGTVAEVKEGLEDLIDHIPDDRAALLARKLLKGRGIVQGLEVENTPQSTIWVSPGVGITSDGYLIQLTQKRHFTHYRMLVDDKIHQFGFLKRGGTTSGIEETWYSAWELMESEYAMSEKEKEDELDKTPATERHAGGEDKKYHKHKRNGNKADNPYRVMPLTPHKSPLTHQPFFTDKVVLVLRAPDSNVNDTEKLIFILVSRSDIIEILQGANTIRRLLGNHPDADNVFAAAFSDENDIPYASDLYRAMQPEAVLNEVPLHRFGFKPEDECMPIDLDIPDYPPCLCIDYLYNTYKGIIKEAVLCVHREMDKLLRLYLPVLAPNDTHIRASEKLNFLLTKWTAYVRHNLENLLKTPDEKINPLNTQHYIQYFYDWTRDLINGYHELRNELQELMWNANLLDEQLPWAKHPQHLMLGLALRDFDTGMYSPLRHNFVQPPINNGNAARLEACRLYLRRWFEMVQQFYLPGYVIDPDINQYFEDEKKAAEEYKIFEQELKEELGGEAKDEIEKRIEAKELIKLKITPGKNYQAPLSQQSIPYYYPLTFAPVSLQNLWNYRRTKTQSSDRILSYHANDSDDSYSLLPNVIRPLYYTFDAYDFYRIEGHIGQKAELEVPSAPTQFSILETDHTLAKKGVLYRMYELRKAYNLDFEIAAIYCDKATIAPLSEEGYVSPMKFYYIDEEGVLQVNETDFKGPAVKDIILGMDHVSGVPKGGTFLVIIEKETNRIIADFCLNYRLNLKKKKKCQHLIVSAAAQCADVFVARQGQFPFFGKDWLRNSDNINAANEIFLPIFISAHCCCGNPLEILENVKIKAVRYPDSTLTDDGEGERDTIDLKAPPPTFKNGNFIAFLPIVNIIPYMEKTCVFELTVTGKFLNIDILETITGTTLIKIEIPDVRIPGA